MKDSLPDRVKWAREKRGLNAVELSEKAGLSRGHVSLIESGRREHPSADTITKLSKALKVDLTWLMSGGKRPELET